MVAVIKTYKNNTAYVKKNCRSGNFVSKRKVFHYVIDITKIH